MSRIRELLDFYYNDYIKKSNDYIYNLKVIDNYDYHIDSIINYDFTDFLLIYYTHSNISNFSYIFNILSDNDYYLDRIKISDLKFLTLLYEEIKNAHDNGTFKELLVDEDYYDISLENFENINLSKNLKKELKKIFMDYDGRIDFEAYNTFLVTFMNKNSINNFLDIIELSNPIEKINNSHINVSDNDLEDEISNYDSLIEDNKLFNFSIDGLSKFNPIIVNRQKVNFYDSIEKFLRNCLELNDGFKKIIDEYYIFIQSFLEIKNIIKLGKPIDISFYKDRLPQDEELIMELMSYNNNLCTKDYRKERLKYNKLNNEPATKLEKIVLKYNLNIETDKLSISPEELEKKLNILKNYKEIIKYNNIMLNILNCISYDNLVFLMNLIDDNSIDEKFVLNNIDVFSNSKDFYNFMYNITLLKKYNINISNVRKYDYKILFNNYYELEFILSTYSKYGINLDFECYNFECLNNNYSYIIDKFIEIGCYELLINNLSLINSDSNMIVKRCILYKHLNNSIVNEQNKLRGSLRSEKNFIVSDEYLNKTIIYNYEEFIPMDILETLENNISNVDRFINLSALDEYLVNNSVYCINGLYISKNKVLNNLNVLLDNKFDKKYTNKELVLYSMIYNYPLLVNRKIIEDLKAILNKKTKLLILK